MDPRGLIFDVDHATGAITAKAYAGSTKLARGTEAHSIMAAAAASHSLVYPHNSLEWPNGNREVIVDADGVEFSFAGRRPVTTSGLHPRIHGKLTATVRQKPVVGPRTVHPSDFGVFARHSLQDAHDSSDDHSAALTRMFSEAAYYGLDVVIDEGYYQVFDTVHIRRAETSGLVHWEDLYDRSPNRAAFLGQIVMHGIICMPYSASSWKPIISTDCVFFSPPLLRVRRMLSAGDTGTLGWSNIDWTPDLDESTTNGSGRTYWQHLDDMIHNHVAGSNTQLDCGVLLNGCVSSDINIQAIGCAIGCLVLADGTRDMEVSRSRIGMAGNQTLNKINVLVHGRAPNSDLRFQKIELTNPTAGTFTATVDGQTTSGITYNASAEDVKSALEALSTVDRCGVYLKITPGARDRTYYAVFDLAPAGQMTVNDSLLTGSGSASYQTSGGASGYANANTIDMRRGHGSASTSGPAGWYAAIAFTGNDELGDQYFHHGNHILGGDHVTIHGGGRIGIYWVAQSCRENFLWYPWVEQGDRLLWCARPAAYLAISDFEVEDNYVIHDTYLGNIATVGKRVRNNGRVNRAIRDQRPLKTTIEWDASDMLSGLVFSGPARAHWSGHPKFGMCRWWDGQFVHDGSIEQWYRQPIEADPANNKFISLHTLGGSSGGDEQTHGYVDGDQVRITSGTSSYPTGISPTPLYYVVNATDDDFQVSTTMGGSPVSFSGTGANLQAQIGRTSFDPNRKWLKADVVNTSKESSWPGIELHVDTPNDETFIEIERYFVEQGLTGDSEDQLRTGRVVIAGWDGNGVAMDPNTSGSNTVNGRWPDNPPIEHGSIKTEPGGGPIYLRHGSDLAGTTRGMLAYDEDTPINSCHRLLILFQGGTKSCVMSGFRIRVEGNRTARFVIPNAKADYGSCVNKEPQHGYYVAHSSFRLLNPSSGNYMVKLTDGNYAVREQYTNGHYYSAGTTVYTGTTDNATIWHCVYPGEADGVTPDVDLTKDPDSTRNRWRQLASGVQIAKFSTV